MCQHKQPVGGAGEQKAAQCFIACFGIKPQAVEIFIKQIQIVVCQFAQRVQRGGVVHDTVQSGVLHRAVTHDLLLKFR
jgi:hypothetical protein